MKSGHCPKCKSTDIRVGPTHYSRQIVTNTFHISWWRKATPTRYVCVSCGYMEQYLSDDDGRRAIEQKWPRYSR